MKPVIILNKFLVFTYKNNYNLIELRYKVKKEREQYPK